LRVRAALIAVVALVLVIAALVWGPAPTVMLEVPGDAAGFSATIELDEDWGVAPFEVSFRPAVGGTTSVPPYQYTWLFGDGSPPSNEQAPRHVYRLPGRYWATLEVRDAKERSASYMAEIWVDAADETTPSSADAFTARIELDTDWGDAPLTVKLRGSTDGPGATPPFEYSWEFGDGTSPSTEESPSHVFEAVGEYRVLLTIRAATGAIARDYALVWVEEPGMFGSPHGDDAGGDERERPHPVEVEPGPP
jgi:PKD repeat protein